jgi:hypothetical protein
MSDIPDYPWIPPPAILVPHADYGDSKCPGLILPEIKGDQADLVCNDCGAVICTVPAAEAATTSRTDKLLILR